MGEGRSGIAKGEEGWSEKGKEEREKRGTLCNPPPDLPKGIYRRFPPTRFSFHGFIQRLPTVTAPPRSPRPSRFQPEDTLLMDDTVQLGSEP